MLFITTLTPRLTNMSSPPGTSVAQVCWFIEQW
jgi:hypothetical protein